MNVCGSIWNFVLSNARKMRRKKPVKEMNITTINYSLFKNRVRAELMGCHDHHNLWYFEMQTWERARRNERHGSHRLRKNDTCEIFDRASIPTWSRILCAQKRRCSSNVILKRFLFLLLSLFWKPICYAKAADCSIYPIGLLMTC